MNYPEDLCKLAIKNMDIIEKAPSIVESIEEELFAAINDRVKERVEEQKTWQGCFGLVTNLDEEEETSFLPNSWPVGSEGQYIAWYSIDCYCDDETVGWLSCATNVQGSSLTLSFGFHRTYYNMNRKAFRNSLSSFYENKANIQAAGFILSPDCEGILLLFHFDANTLAEEYPNFDESLKPLDNALDALFSVHEEFDGFVKSLGAPGK